MKLIIFGATGTLGKVIVEQALAEGHEVTAFARRVDKLGTSTNNLTLVNGDVFNPEAVTAAIAGHDAVMVALGAGRKGLVRAVGTKNIIDGMKAHNISRLICQTTMGIGDSAPALNFFWKYIMFGLLLKPAYIDHQIQEGYIMKSGLDWTIIRPSAFTDETKGTSFKIGDLADGAGLKLKIARKDVADFMMKQLDNLSYLHKTPSISY